MLEIAIIAAIVAAAGWGAWWHEKQKRITADDNHLNEWKKRCDLERAISAKEDTLTAELSEVRKSNDLLSTTAHDFKTAFDAAEKYKDQLLSLIEKKDAEVRESLVANERLAAYARELDEYVTYIKHAFGLPPDMKRPTPDQVMKSVNATAIEDELGIKGMMDFYRLDALAKRLGHQGVMLVPSSGTDNTGGKSGNS